MTIKQILITFIYFQPIFIIGLCISGHTCIAVIALRSWDTVRGHGLRTALLKYVLIITIMQAKLQPLMLCFSGVYKLVQLQGHTLHRHRDKQIFIVSF